MLSRQLFTACALLLSLVAPTAAFVPTAPRRFAAAVASSTSSRRVSATAPLKMGLFDDPVGWIKRSIEVSQDSREAEAAHILIPVANRETEGPAALAKAEEIKASITDFDSFAAKAAEFSSCPSAAKGGRLGRFKRGQMVPQFDDCVFSEEVGSVCGPITTIYGVHLIWIQARTTA